MQDLTITIVQCDLLWENPKGNYEKFDNLLHSIQQKTDIVVLPEMFATGFTMNVDAFAETMEGDTVKWMQEKSKHLNSVVTGSFIFKKEENVYMNRLVWVQPDGTIQHYDKRHLFRFGNEHLFFNHGKTKCVFSYKDFRVCPLICYDLRFPVWSKNKFSDGIFDYDILIYIANWPEPRKYHWQTLLKARAIENLSYAVGVNRVGIDGRNIKYSGNSMIINPKGEIICEINDHTEDVKTLTINKSELISYREKFNVGLDWDKFTIET